MSDFVSATLTGLVLIVVFGGGYFVGSGGSGQSLPPGGYQSTHDGLAAYSTSMLNYTFADGTLVECPVVVLEDTVVAEYGCRVVGQ